MKLFLKLDSRLQINAIPKSKLLKYLKMPIFRKNNTRVPDYTKHILPIIDYYYIKCQISKYKDT